MIYTKPSKEVFKKIRERGRTEFSDRYTAVNAETTRQGASLKGPLEAIRKKGLIPKAMLPKRDDMTFDQYHDKNAITSEMLALGLEFAARFTINYEKAYEVHFGDLLMEDFLGVGGYAWPKPVNGEYPRIEADPNHAFVIFKTPKYFVFDNYLDENREGDFIKKLAPTYDLLDYGYRIYIAKENIGEAKQLNWLQQLIWGLSDILAGLFRKKNLPVPELPKPSEPVEIVPKVPEKKSLLNPFALAIQSFEGYTIGSRSYRNNNPGNLRWTSYTKSLGATGKDPQNFCIFSSYGNGFEALQQFIKDAGENKLKAYRNCTILSFFKVYAPASDKNKPDVYAKFVAGKLGVAADTLVKNIL